ncbi:MAG: HU family DNA-binding protein [Yoonia sp.]|uniref:HU family DNA-binding protein n=1 Tax=Yoonia sp. TaxID=2212373 RepID=UPI0022041E16|nr:HU family DNA-binding protein [Rhodobacteraceae bacterium S2214]
MADNDTPDTNTVKLKPGKPTAKAKLAPVSTGPKPVVVSVPQAVPVSTPKSAPASAPKAVVSDDGPVKKGPILDAVVEKSGIKRSDAKLVVEALFEVMADKLINAEDMQLPPLGKLKIVKTKDVGKGAKAITLKLRTPNTSE